jgi:hypothetical protein
MNTIFLRGVQYKGIVKEIPRDNLQEGLNVSITYKADQLREQLAHISHSFADYLAVRNMEATYELQRLVFWLTVIIGLPTLIAVIPDAVQVIRQIIDVLLTYIS